jgi:ubiquinone/menaquinone biosynthesis C-methylase UbiE
MFCVAALAGRSNKIVNTDISPTVIDQMAQRFESSAQEWLVDDAMKMQFADSSFDIVLDKGTIDALLCVEDIAAKATNATKICGEVFRCLGAGGKYVIISFGPPETREKHFMLDQLDWTLVSTEKLLAEGKATHYIYTLQKAATAAH